MPNYTVTQVRTDKWAYYATIDAADEEEAKVKFDAILAEDLYDHTEIGPLTGNCTEERAGANVVELVMDAFSTPLTAEQIEQDNPHFKGLAVLGEVQEISITDFPNNFTHLVIAKDSVTEFKASYLWDAGRKCWVLGAN